MASVVKTTAVVLRHGTTAENNVFCGAKGELVVDLGATGTGTDINTTLRLQNGVTTGGIPMARADMANVGTRALATNRNVFGDKNLAYADLSNIETASNPAEIINTFSTYGFAKTSDVTTILNDYGKKDTSNVNTANLTDATIHTGTDGNKPLAYADMSNVDTTNLATGAGILGKHGGKNLAYADLSNVDTTNLNFATKDLQNVTSASWQNIVADTNNDIQAISNKDTVIDVNNINIDHYPTTQAVVNYVVGGGGGGDVTNKLNTNFDNAYWWEPLYSDKQCYYNYSTDITNIISAGTGFAAKQEYNTNKLLTSDSRTLVKIETVKVNANDGTIIYDANEGGWQAEIVPEYGTINFNGNTISINNGEGRADITIAATPYAIVDGTQVYSYSVTNVQNDTGHFKAKTNYVTSEKIVTTPLLILKINEVDANGSILSYKYKPESGYTEFDETITYTPASGTASQIKLVGINTFPQAGGAGLLKSDLLNLTGMTSEDINAEHDSDWKIRHDIAIPLTVSLDSDEYYRIVTAGLVTDAINNYTLKNNAVIPGECMALRGSGDPNSNNNGNSTPGSIGQLYVDTTNDDGYMCVKVSGSTYTWKQITI